MWNQKWYQSKCQYLPHDTAQLKYNLLVYERPNAERVEYEHKIIRPQGKILILNTHIHRVQQFE